MVILSKEEQEKILAAAKHPKSAAWLKLMFKWQAAGAKADKINLKAEKLNEKARRLGDKLDTKLHRLNGGEMAEVNRIRDGMATK